VKGKRKAATRAATKARAARGRIPMRPPPAEPGSFDHWQESLSESERRIDEIVQKMRTGAWLTGVSERALAKDWNVAPDTVRKLSSEASRVIRREMRIDPAAREEARAAVMQTFEVIRAKAMAKGDPQSLRVALDATRALGFYMGAEPAKQLEVGRMNDPLEGWSLEEKLAFARDGARPRRAIGAATAPPTPAERRAIVNGNGAVSHGAAHPDDDASRKVH
jgi:hypothetical protein